MFRTNSINTGHVKYTRWILGTNMEYSTNVVINMHDKNEKEVKNLEVHGYSDNDKWHIYQR